MKEVFFVADGPQQQIVRIDGDDIEEYLWLTHQFEPCHKIVGVGRDALIAAIASVLHHHSLDNSRLNIYIRDNLRVQIPIDCLKSLEVEAPLIGISPLQRHLFALTTLF